MTVQRDVRWAKENFFKQRIEKNKGNSERLWHHLRKKVSGSFSKTILDDSKKVYMIHPDFKIFLMNFIRALRLGLVSKLPSSYGMFSVSCFFPLLHIL